MDHLERFQATFGTTTTNILAVAVIDEFFCLRKQDVCGDSLFLIVIASGSVITHF